MAYTPINWQTGDTITAEKMNKMDNGWSVQNAQLFSETVTTEDTGEEFSAGALEYSEFINAETINVLFDSVAYTCPRIDSGGDSVYGGFDDGPDFTTYPFFIYSASVGSDNSLVTPTAGTHTVAVIVETIEVSSNFNSAVNKCVDTGTLPMLCVSGVTTETEMETTQQGGKLLYFKYSNNTYIITGVDSGGIWFMPSNSSIVPAFIDGVFDIGEA